MYGSILHTAYIHTQRHRASENKVMRRIDEPKTEEAQEDEENYISSSFVIHTLHRILLGQ
jgi:hypothetical protein